MPNTTRAARLTDELLERAREVLGLSPDAPPAHIIRAALEKLTGVESPTGDATYRGGRPPRRSADRESART